MANQPLRFSHLKHMAQSPAHYLASLTATYDSPAMRLGRLVHQMVLTPDQPAVVYDGTRRGRDWESFKTQHAGVETIFTAAEEEQAMRIADAVLTDPNAKALLRQGGMFERRIAWTNAGRACAGTPDLFNETFIVDLKTCATAAPNRWLGRYGEIRKRHYEAQVSWYQDGLDAAGFQRPKQAYLIAVETRAPFPVVVYRVCDSELEYGRRIWTGWLERLRVCEESNHFPGYSQAVVDVEAVEEDEIPALDWSSEEEESEAA